MILDLVKMALVLIELGVLIAAVKLIERRFRPHPEVCRKLLHVVLGLTVLTFPWLFDQAWPVVALSVIAAAGLAALRFARGRLAQLTTVIAAVRRPSFGELYYPLAVGVLWLLSGGDVLLFGVPMLVLTLADAVAALIGVRYGSVHYDTLDGRKSAEGSAAFLVVTFLSVHIPVLLMTQTGRAESLLLALIVALLVMLLESIAWHGLDNLFVPLGTFAFLSMYLDADAAALAWRSLATIGFVFFMLAWRRRSSLDDAALLAGALYGYAALMLGGWLWLYPPVMVFAFHSVLWARDEHSNAHHVGAVIAVTLVGFLCLILHARGPDSVWLWPYATSFAAHLAMVGASYLLWQRPLLRWASAWRVALAALGGWGVVLLPLLFNPVLRTPADIPPVELWRLVSLTIGGVALAAVGFTVLMPRLYADAAPRWLPDATGLGLGLIAAVSAWIGAATFSL